MSVEREPFRVWLRRQAGRNHVVSVAAHGLPGLADFPWGGSRLAMLDAAEAQGSPELVKAFEVAFREYLARQGLQPRSIGYVWSIRAGGWSLPEITPWLPRGAVLRLHVGDVVCWEGRVDKEVWSWAVWCAARVAYTWECPPDVLRFFASQSRRSASRAASAIERLQQHMRAATPPAARATLDLAKMPGNPDSKTIVASTAAARLADCAGGRKLQTSHAMARQLRAVLLQKALPRDLWQLPDSPDVLADYLLENQQLAGAA